MFFAKEGTHSDETGVWQPIFHPQFSYVLCTLSVFTHSLIISKWAFGSRWDTRVDMLVLYRSESYLIEAKVQAAGKSVFIVETKTHSWRSGKMAAARACLGPVQCPRYAHAHEWPPVAAKCFLCVICAGHALRVGSVAGCESFHHSEWIFVHVTRSATPLLVADTRFHSDTCWVLLWHCLFATLWRWGRLVPLMVTLKHSNVHV